MTDRPLADIVTSVGVLARQYQAVIDLAAAVNEVQKLDQMRSEASALYTAQKAKLDDLTGQVAVSEAEIAKAKRTAAEIVADAREELEQLQAKIAAGKATISDIDRQLASRRGELETITGRLDAARAKVGALLNVGA